MTNDAVISTEGRNLLRQESLSFPELLSRYCQAMMQEGISACYTEPLEKKPQNA